MESVSDIDVRQTRLDIADGLNIASSTLEAVGFYEGWVCFVGVMLVPRLPMTTRPQRAFFHFFFSLSLDPTAPAWGWKETNTHRSFWSLIDAHMGSRHETSI
jgi:hypothetical protein